MCLFCDILKKLSRASRECKKQFYYIKERKPMRTTKKALTLSILSVLLCVAMLVGTTFAWFSDSVTSGANKIVAGNLDIDVEYSKDGTSWTAVEGDSGLFADISLWEPGAFSVVYLRVSNKGTLALKYRLAVTTEGGDFTNQAGEAKNLKDALKFAQIASSALVRYETREDAAAATAENAVGMNDFTQVGTMAVGDVSYITLVVAMPSDIGNEFNYKTGTPAPVISLSLTVNAAQLSSESDSFDNTYDLASPWVGGIAEVPAEEDGVITIMNAEQLAGFAKAVNEGNDFAGKTVVLGKDLDLNNVLWTPIGTSAHAFNGTFDGKNHTVRNLTAQADNYAGLFGNAFSHAVIKNVKVVNANVSGHNKVAVILGGGYADIFNCDVENATVVATTWKVDGNWDDGDKAGVIAGQIKESYSYTVKDCDVKNATVEGYRDVGAIAGYGYTENVFLNNTATDVVLVNNRTRNYKNYASDADFDVREIVGEYAGAIDASNVATNVTFKVVTNESLVKDALAAAQPGDTVIIPETEQALGIVELPASLENVTIKGAEGAKVVQFAIPAGANIKNVTVENVNFDLDTEAAIISIGAGAGVENVVFTGCEVNANSGSKYRQQLLKFDGSNSGTVTIENSVISNIGRGLYCSGAFGSDTNIRLVNTVIKNSNSWACQCNGNAKSIYIEGCTFENVDGIAKLTGTGCEDFTFINNTILPNEGSDPAVFHFGHDNSSAKAFSITATNSLTVYGNKIGTEDWTPDTSYGLNLAN